MEVHAHTHPPAGGHRKKWTHYFWEFLMLFLAVFCGFTAENIREHSIEHQREKQYMVSLYQDLKTDTLALGNGIYRKIDEIANYDSLFGIFRSKRYLQETRDAYYYGRRLVNFSFFYSTDGTVNQLENAGGFRLIRKRAVVDSIQSYQQAISRLTNLQLFEKEHFMAVRGLMGKIFDADVFDSMIENANSFNPPDKDYPLMPFTASDLNDFHVPMNFIKRNKQTQIRLLKELYRRAADLMQLLREEYKINKD